MAAVSRRTLLLAGASVLPAFAIAGPPDTYSAAPLTGRVVDAETGEPLAGAVVVADWTLWQRGPFVFRASDRFRRYEVQEAVTDAQGRYRLPGWGPRERPSGWDFHPQGIDDPRLAAFKPGFEPEYWNNERPAVANGEPFNKPEAATRLSAWDGKDLRLHKYGAINRRSAGVVDPSIGPWSPRDQALGRLKSFAAYLEENVRTADSFDASGSSEPRRRVMRQERQALVMVDDALREFTGREYDPLRWTSGEVEDYVKQQGHRGSSQ